MVDFVIQVKKLCIRCGEALSVYAKYCTRCGKGVEFRKHLETDKGKEFFDYNTSDHLKKMLQFRTIFLEKYNSIMKVIKDQFLDEEEEVVIELPRERNVLKKSIGDIQVGTLFFVPLLIVTIVALFLLLFEGLAPDLLFVMISGFAVMTMVPLYPLCRGIFHYRKIRKFSNMSLKELKSYLELDLITNRCWISKSFDVIVGDIKSDLELGIERLGDNYLPIDLNAVEIKIDHMGYLKDFTIRAIGNSTGTIIHSSSISSTISGASNMVSKLGTKIPIKKELSNDGSIKIRF